MNHVGQRFGVAAVSLVILTLGAVLATDFRGATTWHVRKTVEIMTMFRRLTPAQTQRQLKYERLAGAAMAHWASSGSYWPSCLRSEKSHRRSPEQPTRLPGRVGSAG
jgi:hypothetical protein